MVRKYIDEKTKKIDLMLDRLNTIARVIKGLDSVKTWGIELEILLEELETEIRKLKKRHETPKNKKEEVSNS